MRYGIIPSTLWERLALLFGRVPLPMVDAVFGPLKARAIMAGVRLGIFEAMREGEREAADLAATLHLNVEALELLLRTLVVCDYLVERGRGFALSRTARRTLVSGAELELTGYMRFNYEQWRWIEHLEDLVRTGRGVDFHETMTDPERWRDYQLGMLEVARFNAPIVAARVPVRNSAGSLLDLAGAHGLFGAAICRRHPPMRATVIDLPQALLHARVLGDKEGLADVVTYREGHLLTTDYGQDHDVVLLSYILHHFKEEEIDRILRRSHAALRADGTVAVWDLEAPQRGSPATSGDGAALFFRLTSTAGAYHGDQYAEWLGRAGFSRISIARPVLAHGNVLVCGRR